MPETVERISSSSAVSFEDSWYDITSPEHFWMEWRRRATLAFFRRLGLPLDAPLRVLDVGGGHGVLRSQLEAATPWTVDLCDLNLRALQAGASARGRSLLYDVFERAEAVRRDYDAVLLFDVIEHIQEPTPFVAAAADHLRPGGWLLINVPAMNAFFSTYDTVIGHFRRYDEGSLAAELAPLPLELVATRHWGVSLIPVLAARRALLGNRVPMAEERAGIVRTGCQPPNPLSDALLRLAMVVETSMLPVSPYGASLLAAARKR